MSSSDRFTEALKKVFAVGERQPPPPPSSRWPRPSAAPPPPRPPHAASGAQPHDSARRDGHPPGVPQIPDSLVPVRLTDLVAEPPDESAAKKSRTPRGRSRAIGAFVAGAALMLVMQAFVTRRGHREAAHSKVPAQAAKPVDGHAAPPKALEAFAARPPSVTADVPRIEGPAAPPAVSAEPAAGVGLVANDSASRETSPAPSASAVESSGEQRPPAAHKRKRVRSTSPGYEPPTAEFPDPGRESR